MTPRELLREIQDGGVNARITSTGGDCGAISLVAGGHEILITPDDGPWATPYDDSTDVEGDWFIAAHPVGGDGGTWIDCDLVTDGDATVTSDGVCWALAGLLYHVTTTI